MDLQLSGKVALLAGGCGSIGRAVASVLRAEGAVSVIADLAESRSTAAGWLAVFGFVPLEITDEASVRAAADEVCREHGRIDVLVVLAGVYQARPAVEISAEEWDRLLDVNLKGTFLICRDVLPRMQAAGYGRIICLASLAGQVGGVVAGAHYAASKAGVLSLVKSLARQARDPALPGQDITVNAVSPGPVESTMTAGWPDEDRRRMMAQIPLCRFARPEEVADVVAFLASPRAGYIHGARIDVNGGAFMG